MTTDPDLMIAGCSCPPGPGTVADTGATQQHAERERQNRMATLAPSLSSAAPEPTAAPSEMDAGSRDRMQISARSGTPPPAPTSRFACEAATHLAAYAPQAPAADAAMNSAAVPIPIAPPNVIAGPRDRIQSSVCAMMDGMLLMPPPTDNRLSLLPTCSPDLTESITPTGVHVET